MAMTPFTAGGISYEVDDQGTIYQGGRQVPTEVARNVDVQAAAAAAQNPAATTTTPGGTPTSTTPPAPTTAPPTNAYGTKGEPAYSSTNPPPSAPPPAAPTTNTTSTPPPRAGIGSATELRTQRDAVQKQLDDIQKVVDPAYGPTPPQASLIASLNTRLTSLTEAITKQETPTPKSPTAVGATFTGKSPWAVIDNADGTITPVKDPTYTGQIQPQIVERGNHALVITPPTADELTKDPAAAPHVSVGYTDTDAQTLANRTADVADKNATTAAAAQATNDYAARAKADLDARVSRGEDAASIRAEQAQKLQELHDAWVRADGDRRASQQQLDSYNANRHNVAQETLQQSQIDATAKAQAAQDATQRYGYKTSAETSRYATDVAARTAKMQAGNQFLQNTLTTLSEINKALPPGSDLAGKALEGMLAYGQKFLEGMGGAAPVAPSLDGTAPAVDKGAVPPIDVQPASSPNAETVSANTTGAAVGSAIDQSSQAATVGNAMGNAFNQPGPSGGLDWLFGSSASPVANPATVAAANQATTDAQAASIAAQHQANMAPDGTPWTKPADVARVFGRGGNA